MADPLHHVTAMQGKVLVSEVHSRGGVAQYTQKLCTALSDAGLDVVLLTSKFSDVLNQARNYRAIGCYNTGVPTGIWGHRGLGRMYNEWWYLRNTFMFLRHYFAHRPDVVHVQWPLHMGREYWLMRVVKMRRASVIYTLHDLIPDHAPENLRRGFRNGLQRCVDVADHIIVHAKANVTTLTTMLTVPIGKISIIPFGAFGEGQRPDMRREEARQMLGLSSNARVALFFGYIKPYKGLHYLIEAFRHVVERVPNAHLVIAGSCGEFSPFREQIRQAALEEHTTAHIKYIDSPDEYFAAADCLVIPHLAASQSGLPQLAYAYARPVIGTRCGGIPETVESGRTGLLVPPADVSALESAIVDLLSNPQRAAEMGLEGQRMMRARPSWTDIARRTVEIYGLRRKC